MSEMSTPPQSNQALSADQLPAETEPASSGQPPEPAQPIRKFKLTWQFAAGFLGWFLVNGLLWVLISGGRGVSLEGEGTMVSNGICIFPVNLALMFLLLWRKNTRKIGQGILAAFGVNLIISLILGLSYNAFCLVPFFNK